MVLSALKLRRALGPDIAVMRAIESDAAHAFAAVPGYEFCVSGEDRSVHDHQRVQVHGQALIAELDGTGIGFVLVEPVDGRAHILEVAIACAYQRKGLGRTLLDAAELAAKDMGLAKMSLITYRDIAWNAPFYRKLGYSELPHVAEGSRLAAIMREEIDAGIAAKPRIAMVKAL